tara:strand:+ start:75 stop:719 length:645 start_codon:yes stop_codon:yes gene_type:complete
MSKVQKNYNNDYFEWYKEIGEFGALINIHRFTNHIDANDTILDFGCGGGFMLDKINCRVKHGVEINPKAINFCKSKKIYVYENSKLLPKNFYDVIISNNTLQHCENPFLEINNLYNSLKKNGKIVLITGCSSKNLKYKVNDINYQLYSFSPMNLGNILDANGFEIIKVEKIQHRWIPKYIFFYKLFGRRIFNFLCYIYSFFDNSIINIIAIGKK